MATLLALNAGFLMLPPAMAGPLDGIVTDGRTQTGVAAVGNTVSVNTATVKGSNAFNSFSAFNVQAGITANMYVPNGANNLINIVSGSRSNIDGVLNSVRNGAIGGNVWFVNPYGLVVGASGVVNVGSLNVTTPTSQFVSNFFRAPGTPDDASVSQLLNGQAPRNPNSTVSIYGRINAVNGVALSAGAVNVSGSIFSGAHFIGSAPHFSDVVNANGLANGTSVVVQGGKIQIVADGNAAITGVLNANGSAGVTAGAISVVAGKNVELGSGAQLNARGEGANSSGGKVYVYGENAAFRSGAQIDTSAGTSGDGGAIELSASRDVTLGGGVFKAGASAGRSGSVLIDPADLVISNDLTLNDGTNIALLADNSITVESGVVVSSRKVGAGNQITGNSTGNSGDITITAPKLVFKDGSATVAHVETGSAFQAGDVTLTATQTAGGTASIDVGNAIITGRKVTLDARSTLSDSSVLVSTGINKAEAAALINLQGATISASGDLVVSAAAAVNTRTNAVVPLPLSVQRVASQAAVEVGGASVLTAGGNASLAASSTVTTEARPAAPATARAGDAAVAVSDVDSSAKVHLTGTSSATIAGSLGMSASNSVTVQAIADAAAAGGTAAGASVAVSKLRTDTSVVVDAAAVVQAGALTLDALSINTVTVTAKASAQGADKDQTGNSDSSKYLAEYKNSAKTSDADTTAAPESDASGVKVAGAVAVSDVASTTLASLASSQAAVVGGAASLQSQSSNTAAVTSDASSANGGAGVAVAVAINLAKTDNKAVVDQALTAGSLSLSAGMSPGADTSAFTTAAISGAGASNVGLAGSLAVNAIDAAAAALLAQNAAYTRSAGTGVVSLVAVNNTSSTVSATPGGPVTGDKVGIGASVAVNLVGTRTAASLEDNSGLQNAVDVSLNAAGQHTVSTTAEAGSAGGISITPASATSLVSNSTSAYIGSGTALVLGGDLSVKAQQASTNTTSAKGSAVGGKAAIGAAVGVALVDDLVEATTARSVNAGGNVAFDALGASASDVAAVASASGGHTSADAGAAGTDGKPKEDASIDDKVGKQLGFGKKAQADNQVGDSKQQASTTTAVADQKGGKGSASTSEGKVSVAAAVGVNIQNSTASATIPAGGSITAGGKLTLNASNNTDGTVSADGSALPVAQGDGTVAGSTTKVGIGAAVAVNVVKAITEATIGQNAVISAKGVVLKAGITDVKGDGSDLVSTTAANAKSGAGGSSVGLAGSLALNLVDTSSRAAIEGGATSVDAKSGDVSITAQNATDSSANAAPSGTTTGGTVGIGASVAVNVVANRTSAEIADGAALTGAKDVTLGATANNKTATSAEAGSAGGIAITPSVAVALVNNTTSADLGTAASPLTLSGDLSVSAKQTSVNTTTAKGSAVGGKAAIGAAVGVALIDDLVEATTARGVNATGNVAFEALGASASNVTAVASASGGHTDADAGATSGGKKTEDSSVDDKVGSQLDFGKKNQTDSGVGDTKQKGSTTTAVADQKGGKGSASTSEGKVSVAAAVGVNIQNSTASATIPAGGSITAGGKLTLNASNNTDGTVSADGSALPVAQGDGTVAGSTTKVGIGAAVAVNVVRSTADALIGQNATVNANGLSLNAGMTDVKGDGSDLTHTLSAQASSGAGGSSVGVAGSLALNLIDTSSQAQLQTGSTVNAGLGAVLLTAAGNTDTTANAAPHDGGVTKGGKVGIGASVAVNVVANRVLAELQDGSVLNAPGSLTLKADSTDTTTTTAEAGSAGGISITPVLALAMVNNSTTARLGASSGALANAGSVTVSARQATTTKTSAKGSAKGDDAAIGAAVAIALVNDVTLATTDRDITAATGDVTFTAQSSSDNITASSASSKGGKSDDQAGVTGTDGKKQEDATVDDKVGNQLSYGQQQQTNSNVGSADQKSATGSSATAKPSAKSSEGKVSVAAAVSVNAIEAQTTATIGAGRTVSTTGALGISASGNTDSQAKSDGTAVGKTAQVGIGAAVSVNKVQSHTVAGIGNNTVVGANGVSLVAGMTDVAGDKTHTINAEAASGAGGSKVGIAASLALNLADTSSKAQIGSGVTLNAKGQDVSLTALDSAAYTAKATPTTTGGATGGNVGVGVSVALNVINASSLASIGQNATVSNVRDLKVSATSEVDSDALATAGAAGGKLAFDAAVAITTLNQSTEASIASGGAITTARNVELDASSTGTHSAMAKGEAKSGSIAIGASVGVLTSDSTTKATLDRDVAAGGTLGILANSSRAYTSDATASAGGSQSQDTYDQNKTQADSASSSKTLSNTQSSQSNQGTSGGGKVAIAAAVGVTVLSDKVDASVANGHTLASGGSVLVTANQDSNFSARGAGDAVNPAAKVGVAVGVGIAISNGSTTATLGDNTHVTGAQDITVRAESTQNRGAAFANKLAAEGIAGAGGSKVGVAGAFAVAVSNAQTVASMGNNTRIDAARDISLQAHNTSMLGAKAWAGAVGGNVGVGASVATIVSNNEYRASVGGGSNITAATLSLGADNYKVTPGTFSLSVNSIDDVKSIPDQLTHGTLLGGANYYSEAIAGSAGDTAAVSGAFAVNVFTDKTETALGSNTTVTLGNTGALKLDALNDTTATSLAGALAVGGKVGVGVSSAVAKSTNDTSAHIDEGTVVSNSGSITLNAANKQAIDLISFSGGIGGNVGVSGTANVLLSKNTAQAYVANGMGTSLTTKGDLSFNASNVLKALNIASGVAVGGSVGVGVAAAINTVENVTFAAIGDDATTNAAGATKLAAAAGEDITTFAVGAGGAGSVAVGGAALVNVMNNETTASIGDRTRVNYNQSLVSQSVGLAATDTTKMIDVAGGVAGGGSVGAGASANVSVLSKKTHAMVGASARVDAAQDVNMQALSTEFIGVGAVGLGVGGSAGLAGSAAAISLTTDTVASVKDSAALRAKSDVSVAANGSTTIELVTGAVSAGGSAAVGAAAGVVVLDKTTKATIGNTASITALGQGSGVSASNGDFTIAYNGSNTSNGGVAASGFAPTDANGHAITDRSVFNALVQQRDATANTSLVTGVAVTATNQDSISSFAVTGSGAGTAAIALGANVATVTTDTQATVGAGTNINQDTVFAGANGGTTSTQSMRIAAGNDQFHLGIAGAASGAGAVAVGAGTDVFIAGNNVLAQIGADSQVKAARNVEVLARGSEQVLDIGVGMAASGSVAVAGSVSVVSLSNSTKALIAGGTTRVDAGGNAQVNANDKTTSDMIAGAAAAGFGVAGVGAAVGVTTITKDTQAAIGNGSTVNALGGSGATAMTSFSGTTEDAMNTAQGLQVQATSSEDLFTVTASGAGGFYAGVSGAVAVEVVKSNTQASIGDNAKINTVNAGADSAQDVNVTARNVLTSKVIVGSLAVGAAGLAGAVDVGIAKNNTSASVGAGSQVNANRDVLVNAIGKQSYDTTVISGAGGLVGIAAGVAAYSIGDQLSAEAQGEISKNNSTVGAQADKEASDGSVGNMLAGSDDARMRSVAAQAQGKRSSVNVSNTFTATQPAGNSASIGDGTTVIAGRDLDVNARGKLDFTAKAGAVAGGAVSLGAGVGIANIKLNNQATLGNNVTAAVGTQTTSGDLRVNAAVNENASATGFAGTGGIVAVNAAYAGITDSSNTLATAGTGLHVKNADEVQVQATDARSVNAKTFGASVGYIAAGASVAQAEAGGSTTATIGSGANIGSDTGDLVRTVNVLADSNTHAQADSIAIAGGIGLAVSGSVATATATPTVEASIAGGIVKTTEDLTVRGTGRTEALATAKGVNLSLTAAAGLSKAVAEGSSTVNAYLGNDISVTGRNLTVEGRQVLNGLGPDVAASATGASGALFAGINATQSNASNTSNVTSRIGDGSKLTLTGAALVNALNNTQQSADVSGVSAGIVAVGFNQAEATSNTTTEASLGNNVTVAAPVTLPATMVASLSVTANGTDINNAKATSGSGGVVSGAAAAATTHSTSNTIAKIGTGDASHTVAATSLTINAAHTTEFNSMVDSVNAAVVGASGANALNTVDSTVTANSGGFVRARFVDLQATNNSRKAWLGNSNGDDADWNINSGSGGVVDLPAATSQTNVSQSTTASIGAGADVHVLGGSSNGTFNMDALNNIVLQDKAKLDSGGVISIAKAKSIVNVTKSDATVSFGDNSAVVNDMGSVNAGARADVTLDARSSANVYGLAGAPSGQAYATYTGQNTASVGTNASIEASDSSVLLGAGQGSDGTVNRINASATVNLWNKTAFPINTDPDAQANVVNNALVNMATGSSIKAAEDIALYADKGQVTVSAMGIGKDLYREAAAAVASGISNLFGGGDVNFDIHGGSTSSTGLAKVNVDGKVLTGVNRSAWLTLGIELIDANGNRVDTPVKVPVYETNGAGQFLDSSGNVTTIDSQKVKIGDRILWRLAIDKSDNVGIQKIDTAQSVSAGIQDRITKLRSLMAQYAGDPVAVGAYEAEVNFLMFKLVQLGLASGTFAADGTPTAFNPGQWNNPSPQDASRQQILLYQAQASGATTAVNTSSASLTTTASTALTSAGTIISNASTITGGVASLGQYNNSIKGKLGSLANFNANDTDYQNIYGSSGLINASNLAASTIASTNAQIQTLKSSVTTATQQINTLTGEINTRNNSIIALGSSSSAADIAKIAVLRSEIDSRQATIATSSTQISGWVAAISTQSASVASSAKTVSDNAATIKSLQTALAAKFSDGSDSNKTVVTDIGTSVSNGDSTRTAIVSSYNTIKTQATAFSANLTGYAASVASSDTALHLSIDSKASAQTQITTLTANLPNLSSVAANGPIADFVHVDDITVKLGNIRTKGDQLTGTGALQAPGDAHIDVTNNTPDFLVLNKLTVNSDDGGTVRLNGVLVNSGADVNRINTNGTGASGLQVLTRDTQGAAIPQINVNSNYDPNAAGTVVVASAPDIQLQGDITNLRGSVTVHSKAGSILSNANVNAGSVDVRADNGDFVQSYVDNFFHVGGDAGSIKDGLTTTGGGIVANGSVFISARYLNINSLVQSGIENWNITLPTAPKLTGPAAYFGLSAGSIAAAQKAYDDALPADKPALASANLINSNGRAVLYNAVSKRIEVDMAWANADKVSGDWATRTGVNSGLYTLVSDYGNIGSSYDPTNNRFVLDGTQVRGGSIQLYGQIMNTSETGGGILRALDGYGQITINNPTGLAVVINNLDTGADPTGTGRGVAGVIDITDIQGINGTSLVTERTIYKRENGVITKNAVALAGTNRDTTYAPQQGLRYNWTTGTDNSQVRYWEFKGTQWFGSSSLRTTPTGDVVSQSPVYTLNAYRLDDGTYLTKDAGQTGTVYTASTDTRQDGASIWTKTREWTKCNWWTLCIASKYYTDFNESIASKSITTKSLKADNAIKVQFSGSDAGTVAINSNSDVLLAGAIRNKVGDTTVNAGINNSGTTVTAGQSIIQMNDTALTSGKNVTLNASGSVGAAYGSNPTQAIALEVKDGVLNADARNGNVLVAQTLGDLNVGMVKAAGDALNGLGRVTLNSDGTISATNAASRVQGNLINLTSNNGGIGSTASPLKINVGYTDNIAQRGYYGIKAKAAGDIGLEATTEFSGNPTGNLLVDTIVSTGGNVTVKAPGAIVDNNATEQIDTRTWDQLKNYWDSMGLRAGTAENDANKAATVRAFEQSKTQDYRMYWDARMRQADQGLAYDASFQYKVSDAERTSLVASGVNVADFEADRTAQYHRLNASVGDLTAAYSGSYAYVASDADKFGADGKGGLLAKSSWSDRELALSISAGLLKEVTNTNPVVKDANIQGRNVTITAGKTIGETDAALVIPTNVDPTCSVGPLCLTDAMKVALAAAERNDIIVTDGSITVLRRKPVNFAATGALNVAVTAAPVVNTDTGNAYLASLGDARLGNVSIAGDTRIKVRGNIVNASDSSAAVQTGDLILEAANGGIGYLPPEDAAATGTSSPLRINQNAGATLIARADNNIDIVESDNMRVDTVYSRKGIKLTANSGSITDAFNDTQLNVFGDSVDMKATGGSIGTSANALDVSSGLTGKVSAMATGGVYLNGPIGHSFNVGGVSAGGDISLSSVIDLAIMGPISGPAAIALAAGNQVSFSSAASVTASAQNVSVDANSLKMADGATLRANLGTVAINTAKDATITGISTGNNTASAVTITAGGDVVDGGDTQVDITADGGAQAKVTIAATGSIGKGNPLEIKTTNFNATAGGDADVNFDGPVGIDTVTAGDRIAIVATGSVTGNAVSGTGLGTGTIKTVDVTSIGGKVDLLTVHGKGDVSVAGDNGVTAVNASSTDGGVTLGSSSGNVVVQTAQAGGDITLAATSGSVNAAQTSAGGGLSAKAGNAITVGSGISVGAVALNAGTTLTATTLISTAGSIDTKSVSASSIMTAQSAGDATFAGDTLDLTSITSKTGNVKTASLTSTLIGDVVAEAGDITTKSGTSMKITNATAQGNFNTAGDTIEITNVTTKAGAIVTDSVKTTSINTATAELGNISMKAGTGIMIATANAQTNITAEGDTLNLTTLTSKTGNVNTASLTSTLIGDVVAEAGDITTKSGTSMKITNATAQDNFNTAGDTIEITNVTTKAGAIVTDSVKTTSINSATAQLGKIAATSGTEITIDKATGQLGIVLNAGGKLKAGNLTSQAAQITTQSGTDTDIGTALASQDVDVVAGESLKAGTLTSLHGTVRTRSGRATTLGSLTAKVDVSVDAGTSLTADTLHAIDGDVQAKARDGDLTIGTLESGRNADVEAQKGDVKVSNILVGGEFALRGFGDVAIDKAKVGGTFVLSSTGGSASAGKVDADSAVITAPNDVTVGRLDVKTRFVLQGNNVSANVYGADKQIKGTVTGYQGSTANNVELAVSNPNGTVIEQFQTHTANINVPEGALDVLNMLVVDRATLTNPLTTIVIDQHDRSIQPGANVQLYSATSPFTLSLFDNHVISSAYEPYRDASHDGLVPTGLNQSVIETSEKMLTVSTGKPRGDEDGPQTASVAQPKPVAPKVKFTGFPVSMNTN